jgi:hypothetical protein
VNLDNQISNFLARAETRPAQSKLDPYYELIRGLRQRRWTYQEIAAVLRDEFAVSAAPSTIHAFMKVRMSRRAALVQPQSGVQAAAHPSSRVRFKLDA